MTLNRKAFADRMAAKGGITKKVAQEMTDLFVETLIDCLKEEEVVRFLKFGRFEMKTIRKKPARNINTGEKYVVPAHKKVKFYASDGLADRMKE